MKMTTAIVGRASKDSTLIDYITVTSDGYYSGLGKDLVVFCSNQNAVDNLLSCGPKLTTVNNLLLTGEPHKPNNVETLEELKYIDNPSFIYLWVPIGKEFFAKELLYRSNPHINFNQSPYVDEFITANNNGGIWLCSPVQDSFDWFFTKTRCFVDAFMKKCKVAQFIANNEIPNPYEFLNLCDKSLNLSNMLKDSYTYFSAISNQLAESWKQYVKQTFGAGQYENAVGTILQPEERMQYINTLTQVALLMEKCPTYTKSYIENWLEKLQSVESFLKKQLEML